MIKRYLLTVSVMLCLVCGTAFAAPVSLQAGVSKFDEYSAAVDGLAVPITAQVSQVMEPRSLPGYQAPNTRSDMRVASAGMVFDRVDGQPHAESTVPS